MLIFLLCFVNLFSHLFSFFKKQDFIAKTPGKTNGDKFNSLYQTLQRHVHELFDSDVNKNKTKITKGIKQVSFLDMYQFLFYTLSFLIVSFNSLMQKNQYILSNLCHLHSIFFKEFFLSLDSNLRKFRYFPQKAAENIVKTKN